MYDAVIKTNDGGRKERLATYTRDIQNFRYFMDNMRRESSTNDLVCQINSDKTN